MTSQTLTLPALLLISWGFSTAACLAGALVGALGAMADNLWSLNRRGHGFDEMGARREAWVTWMALPALAYVLSVVTNIGTSLIDQHGFASQEAWAVLGGGLLFLEIVANVVIARAGRRRNVWESLTDWTSLWTEVDRRRELFRPEDSTWLDDARAQVRRLESRSGRFHELAKCAYYLMGAAGFEWRYAPSLGLFRWINQGVRIRVSTRTVFAWSLRSLWSIPFTIASVISAASWAWLTIAYATTILSSVLVGLGTAIVVLAAVYVRSRGSIIYYARVGAQSVEMRNRCVDAIDALEAEQRDGQRGGAALSAEPGALSKLLRRVGL